jgi:Enolase C-terminal domain-like
MLSNGGWGRNADATRTNGRAGPRPLCRWWPAPSVTVSPSLSTRTLVILQPKPSPLGACLRMKASVISKSHAPIWEFEQTKQVADALSIDVTGGEQDCEFTAWKAMIGMRAVDIVQPDIMYMGGILRTLEVARMAAAAGLPCTPHSANLSLVTMCTMHLLGAIPNAGKYLEFSIEGPDYYPWQDGLFLGDPYKITDGKVTIPDAPGWGTEINPAWLEKAHYHASEL